MQRRDFLSFLGRSSVLGVLSGSSLLQACTSLRPKVAVRGLPPTRTDNVVLHPGLSFQKLISWKDPINKSGDKFGFNNDFIAFLPGTHDNEAFLWVNHEYVNPIFVSDFNPQKNWGVRKSLTQVQIEQKNVGGSYLRITRQTDGTWKVDDLSEKNFRVDASTPMKLVSPRPILNSDIAIGTTGNCCGGKTPWGTVLTCEENFDDFFGNVRFSKQGAKWKRHLIASSHPMAWDEHTPHPPEHYGWVVEINPDTREFRKLTSLGRFAHEGALVVQAADGRCVVYMGDDSQDQHFYKFIATRAGSLDEGKLYVANLQRGSWELLSLENPKLKGAFYDSTDLMIRTREAAKLVGATPLDRPEACAQDPLSKAIFLNCTMNKSAGRLFGSILKFVEKNNDPLSLSFESEVFLHGGPETGFACPDNMCFDKNGNLWMTSDIADYDVNTGEYRQFGNNSLFYIPLAGDHAGSVFRVASAPIEAEMTGPCFSADGKTLFLSIQHPGANTADADHPTSHWPDGGASVPRPSVITLSGSFLEKPEQFLS